MEIIEIIKNVVYTFAYFLKSISESIAYYIILGIKEIIFLIDLFPFSVYFLGIGTILIILIRIFAIIMLIKGVKK